MMEQDDTIHLQPGLKPTSLRKCPHCDTVFNAIAYCPNDGTKLEDYQGEDSLRSLFADKYEILEEIGKGGMGTVYKVKQILLDKVFALKVIPSHYLNEQLAARFQHEAKTMAALDHANLARISDFGIWLNQPFIVMEYVSGSPLSKLIAERVLSPAQAIDLFTQLLDGLEHAHTQGVLHRDIKPSNIMVVSDAGRNKAILLDFGIAKKIEAADAVIGAPALTRTGEMIGSPLYMSPEQARGEKVTERSDLYSLGCALFESLTGTPPFVGKTAVETFYLHIQQTPPSLMEAALGREFSPGLEKVLRQVLAKNPEDRYSSASELKQALSSCLQSEHREEKTHEPPKRKTFLLPAALVVAATLVAVAGLIMSRGNHIENLPANQHPALASGERSLSFTKTSLSDAQVKMIINDGNLVELKLHQCNIPHSMLDKLPGKLERLELNGSGLLSADLQLVATNNNVRTLSLKCNPIDSGLHYLAPMEKLELLDLTSTQCETKSVKDLPAIRNLKYLILLDNSGVNDESINAITDITGLEWLDISDTRVTVTGISKLAKLANLKRLSVKRLAIDDERASVFKDFKALTTLKLSGNPISSAGLKKIPATKNLTELDLSKCHLSDDAVPYLLEFKNMSDLNISVQNISSNALMKLTRLPLKTLNAKATEMTKLEAKEFLKRCPTCQIVYFGGKDDNKYAVREGYKGDIDQETQYQMP